MFIDAVTLPSRAVLLDVDGTILDPILAGKNTYSVTEVSRVINALVYQAR